MKAFVYILQDENGRFYIGSTPTLEKRLKQHANGHTQTTRNMFNPKLVLKQEVSSLVIARKIEHRLKKMKRRDYIEKIVTDGYIKVVE
ncbi:MAG: GIY-YIG nuclease family protein [bacterium]|nr:GIY-YIG nuclease family protein [bacterium]MDZ4206023.1 GIY-YIG nuclease family protein [Patescibacteria group bacterium]